MENHSSSKNANDERCARVFTPKALHNIAQGRERSERTLGSSHHGNVSTLKGSDNEPGSVLHAFRVQKKLGRDTQGALAALATLGFDLKPLRGKYALGLSRWFLHSAFSILHWVQPPPVFTFQQRSTRPRTLLQFAAVRRPPAGQVRSRGYSPRRAPASTYRESPLSRLHR